MFSRDAPKTQETSDTLKKRKDNDIWVSVTWMPHSSLSQTSDVALAVRSLHAVLMDDLLTSRNKTEVWRVEISIHGVGGLPLVPVPTSTSTFPVMARRRKHDNSSSSSPEEFRTPSVARATHDCWMDSMIHLPIRWRELPRDAYLSCVVLGTRDSELFRTTLPLFDAFGRLRMGLQRLKLERSDAYKPFRDSNINLGLSTHHERMGCEPWDERDPVWKASRVLYQLEKFEPPKEQDGVVLHRTMSDADQFGKIPSVPWLDAMTKQRCKEILAEDRNDAVFVGDEDSPAYLILELPEFEVPIIHEETRYPPHSGASGSITALDLALRRRRRRGKKGQTKVASGDYDISEMVQFVDFEDDLDNPVEDKYRTLAHDLLRGLVDPALKPDRQQRDRLAAIIASPSQHPTREEKDLLWRFRFSLVDNRRALTKFLLAVDWTVESEVVQAAELLEQWRRRSPIEVTDALKLLGKHVAFQTSLVRDYAIDTLAAAPDAELRLYLLQLVQAIKYETVGDRLSSDVSVTERVKGVSSLSSFLIDRASRNIELANYLYWYLKVELQDPAHGARYRAVLAALKDRLQRTPFSGVIAESAEDAAGGGASPAKESKAPSLMSIVDSVSKFGHSLRHGESHDDAVEDLKKSWKHGTSVWLVLMAQDRFVSGIMNIQLKSRDAKGKRDAKEIHLKELLSAEGYDRHRDNRPVPLPSAPYIMVNGVNPQSAKVFKSALYPALIEFHVDSSIHHDEFADGAASPTKVSSSRDSQSHRESPPSTYKVIVKTGDDLRQDQLVIMMIQLMDGLLKRGTLDMCLRPYSIISMSPSSGLVEFVDGSIPISQVLANYNNSIMHFFRTCSPQKGTKYDVRPEVITTYVRSCAGYCVITYILGVGDRHLDNIMLQPTGHFFHIDFGFIFGRDPKPLPPAFRLTREMVDGMGGIDSTEYRQFCSLACQAFNTLRKSAGLILNLLHLMSDAGIEDLSNNPTSDAEGVISKVEERFRLDLTDEQAEAFFLGLINDSLAALAPRVMDVFHSLAVARR